MPFNRNTNGRRAWIAVPLCIALAVSLTACGAEGVNWLWQENTVKEPDTGDMIIHVTGTETDKETGTVQATDSETDGSSVFTDGTVVAYTGEAHPGTDICYEGNGANRSRIIVIDAGHQIKGNSGKEPIGPSAEITQAKVSSGTSGLFSGVDEYELNLRVALSLRDELIRRGYSVVMIRETNEVDISNVERAQIANRHGAAAFVRIHANGWENGDMKGAMAVCQTAENPYPNCAAAYAESYRLSEAVLGAYCAATGISYRSIWETDSKAGTNWSAVPTTILEMGFMSNREDDLRMEQDDFAGLAAKGVADGLDAFFAGNGDA